MRLMRLLIGVPWINEKPSSEMSGCRSCFEVLSPCSKAVVAPRHALPKLITLASTELVGLGRTKVQRTRTPENSAVWAGHICWRRWMALSWHRYGYNSGFTVVKPMLKSRHSNHFTPKNLLEDRFRIFIESYLKIAGRSFLPIKNCWK